MNVFGADGGAGQHQAQRTNLLLDVPLETLPTTATHGLAFGTPPTFVNQLGDLPPPGLAGTPSPARPAVPLLALR